MNRLNRGSNRHNQSVARSPGEEENDGPPSPRQQPPQRTFGGQLLSDLVSPALHVGSGTAMFGNAQFLLGVYRGDVQQSVNGLGAIAAGTTLMVGERLTQWLVNRYFRGAANAEQQLRQRLADLEISEACLYQATNLVTFADASQSRPAMNDGEALILADYFRDLITLPRRQIPRGLLDAAQDAENDPQTLIRACLQLLRQDPPVIPSSGRTL